MNDIIKDTRGMSLARYHRLTSGRLVAAVLPVVTAELLVAAPVDRDRT